MFRIGVRFISATANRSQVGKAYSDLADSLIGHLLDAVATRGAESLDVYPYGDGGNVTRTTAPIDRPGRFSIVQGQRRLGRLFL